MYYIFLSDPLILKLIDLINFHTFHVLFEYSNVYSILFITFTVITFRLCFVLFLSLLLVFVFKPDEGFHCLFTYSAGIFLLLIRIVCCWLCHFLYHFFTLLSYIITWLRLQELFYYRTCLSSHVGLEIETSEFKI